MQYFMIHAQEKRAYTATALCGHSIEEATLLYTTVCGISSDAITKIEVIPENKLPDIWKRHYQRKTEDMLNHFVQQYMR